MYSWARREQRRASRKVQRRHSQQLLTDMGPSHRGLVWAVLLDKLGCPLPGGLGEVGTQRQQRSRGALRVFPIRNAESSLTVEGKFLSKIPQCR